MFMGVGEGDAGGAPPPHTHTFLTHMLGAPVAVEKGPLFTYKKEAS